MGAQGLLLLALVYFEQFPSFRTRAFREKLQTLNITIHTYTWSLFKHENIEYVKVPFQCGQRFSIPNGRWYVGSTSCGMSKREWNRLTKIRQLKSQMPVKAELAAKWWASNNNYDSCGTIVLLCTDTYKQSWVQEHVYIGQWQPLLNHPFINRLVRYTARRLQLTDRSQSCSRVSIGHRLWRKVRRRLQGHFRTQNVAPMSTHRGFDFLWQLSSNTKMEFEAQKALRSRDVTDAEVYALHRLCNHLEQPNRSKCVSHLKKVMAFRNMSVPVAATPFSIGALSHPQFFHNCRKWIRKYIISTKPWAIPFHLPTAAVREASHQSFHRLIWNHHQVQPICHCSDIAKFFPELPKTGGHFYAEARDIACRLDPDLAMHLVHNSHTPVFPNKTTYIKDAQQRFDRWCKRQGLPTLTSSQFTDFLEEQWQQHSIHHKRRALREATLTMKRVMYLKRHVLKYFTVHCQDHQPGHLMMFCPLLYYQASLSTWNVPDVFQKLDGSKESHLQDALRSVPTWIKKRYAWGVDEKASLPYGYVLLKKKKQFLSGPTIVAYRGSILAKLLTGAALVLKMILFTIWGENFGRSTMPVMWQKLHYVFAHTHVDEELSFHNDDLVGFFNSIPQDRLLQMVKRLVDEYTAQSHSKTVMVDITSSVKKSAMHSGFSKHSLAANNKTFGIADLVSIVQLSFDCGTFTAVGGIYKQIRGTCMGNQISPILSEIAVSAIEISWLRSFRNMLATNHVFNCWRYVDNRVILMSDNAKKTPAVQTLLRDDFYIPPVELEIVNDNYFLGFDVLPNQRRITYIQPQYKWQIRHPHGACSLKLLYSGLRSRLALIFKYSFPCTEIEPQTWRLCGFFIDNGYEQSQVCKTLEQVKIKMRRQIRHQCSAVAPCAYR